jgi:curved DNA-binding protein CbpA
LFEQNHYEVLEIPANSDARQVERAYQIALATYRPDSAATYSVFSDEDNQTILGRIEEAYGVLSDASQRAEYDRQLSEAKQLARALDSGESELPSGPAAVAEQPGVTPPLRRTLLPPARSSVAPSERRPLEISFASEPEEFAMLIDSASPAPSSDAEESLADGLEPDDGIFDGAALRRIRMSMGTELSEISQRTKISAEHLHNIEEDRFEALPAPGYVRGFVREIARCLRLDPNQVASSYIELMSVSTAARK